MLGQLRRIVQDVAQEPSLASALAGLVSNVKNALQTECCSVYLADYQQQQFMLMATDGLAALPALRKASTNPDTETGAPYAAALFGGLAGVANVQNWVTLEYAFPLYLVAVNIAVLFAIYRKRVPAVSGA